MSTAWRLSQAGFSAAVFDAGQIAGEASAAGAGMLAPGGEAHAVSGWAQDTVTARRMYPSFVEELASESGVQGDFRECGALEVASSDTRWMELLAQRAVQESLGIHVEEISEADARRLVPLLRRGDLRAMWYPDDAVVDPRPITHALRLILCRAGASLAEGTSVARVERQGESYVLLDAADAEIASAHAIVLAAGAWASEIQLPPPVLSATHPLHAAPPRRALPVRGHLIQCRRAPGTLAPIVRESHLYVFQRNGGEVIAGSNEERVGFDRHLNPEAVATIENRTSELMPGLLSETGAESAWLGFRPGIEGDGPELRKWGADRVWFAYGHYRNGILLAPHTAAYLAKEIANHS